MKLKSISLIIILFVFANLVSAQKIELGGTFSSSNKAYYKNAFGAYIGYIQDFKKQYLFLQYKTVSKNNSYSLVAYDITEWPDQNYSISNVDGKLTIDAVKFGVAQKIVNSNMYSISLGISGSLNNVKFDEDQLNIYFAETRIGSVSNKNKKQSFKNKFGYGVFLDLELKQFLIKHLSLYSRVEIEDITLDGSPPRGICFVKSGYSTIGFSLGVRYNFKKRNE